MLGEDAGFRRVATGQGVNAFVVYNTNERKEVEVREVLTEGYISFPELLCEYRMLRDIYEPLEIQSPIALALFRTDPTDRIQLTQQGVRDAITKSFERADTESVVFKVSPHPDTDLDSGLLFRHFKSAVRVQDLYDLALAGEWEKLREANASLGEYPQSLLQSLARTAGQLLQNGIIHGLIYYDYQNITVAGELCTSDYTVVPKSVNYELGAKLESQLQQDEATFGVPLVEGYKSRERSIGDTLSADKSLVEQAYYLWDTALRSFDISKRAGLGTNSPGSVLTTQEIDLLRKQFCSGLVENLGEQGKRIVQAAYEADVDINTDFKIITENGAGEAKLKILLDRGYATIHGWTNPDKPYNHFTHPTTEQDVAYIVEDYRKFVKEIVQFI